MKKKQLPVYLLCLLCMPLITGCGAAAGTGGSGTAGTEAAVTASEPESPTETESTETPESGEESASEEEPESSGEEMPEMITAEFLLERFYAQDNMAALSFRGETVVDMEFTNPGTSEKMSQKFFAEFYRDGKNDHVLGNYSFMDGQAADFEYYSMGSIKYAYDSQTAEWLRDDSSGSFTSGRMIPRVSADALTLGVTKDQYIVEGPTDCHELFNINQSYLPVSALYSEGMEGEGEVTFAFDQETLNLESFRMDLSGVMKQFLVRKIARQWEEDESAVSGVIEVREGRMEMREISDQPGEPIALSEEAKGARWADGRNDELEEKLGVRLSDYIVFDFKEEYKKFSLKGKDFVLGELVLEDLMKSGDYTVFEDKKGLVLEDGEMDYIPILFDGRKNLLDVTIQNTSGGELPAEKCTVCGIDFYPNEKAPFDFRIAGLGPEATLEDIVSVLGNPTYGGQDEDMGQNIFKWFAEKETITFSFMTEDGTLCWAGIDME